MVIAALVFFFFCSTTIKFFSPLCWRCPHTTTTFNPPLDTASYSCRFPNAYFGISRLQVTFTAGPEPHTRYLLRCVSPACGKEGQAKTVFAVWRKHMYLACWLSPDIFFGRQSFQEMSKIWHKHYRWKLCNNICSSKL